MTDEIDGILLTDKRCRILLHAPRPYPGGHGFRQLIDMVGGPFQGSIEAECWQSPAVFRYFHGELLDLYRSLRGKTELSDCYENFKIFLEGDGMGHMTVYVEARAGPTMNIRFSFDFQIDQTELRSVIDSIERLLDQPEIQLAIASAERLVKSLPPNKEAAGLNKKLRGFRRRAFTLLNIVKRKLRP